MPGVGGTAESGDCTVAESAAPQAVTVMVMKLVSKMDRNGTALLRQRCGKSTCLSTRGVGIILVLRLPRLESTYQLERPLQASGLKRVDSTNIVCPLSQTGLRALYHPPATCLLLDSSNPRMNRRIVGQDEQCLIAYAGYRLATGDLHLRTVAFQSRDRRCSSNLID